MQAELPIESPADVEARVDRVFDRIYRLYGGNLKAFFDAVQRKPSEDSVVDTGPSLFQLRAEAAVRKREG